DVRNVQNTSTDYANKSASGLIKTGEGELVGVVVNSHTSGTLRFNDGLTATTAGTKATQVLTVSGVIVPGKHAQSEFVSS
ncbi:hypothetical protein ABK046_51560, partial [Streptomyces caeruleatus]